MYRVGKSIQSRTQAERKVRGNLIGAQIRGDVPRMDPSIRLILISLLNIVIIGRNPKYGQARSLILSGPAY